MKIEHSKLDQKIQMALEQVGVMLEETARMRCPKETGRLAESIYHKVEGNRVTIGTKGVPYAAFVEFGTSSMVSAHGPHDPTGPVTSWEAKTKRGDISLSTMPFLRTAAFEKDAEIKKIFGDALK